ncbi:AAEL012768-PA, partial [Aedes aegypti]
NQNAGTLDISPIGLRVKSTNGREPFLTPFQNIAVWSAVKFVVSPAEGGAAFLPLITDPENIDKRALFRPLSAADKRRLSSGLHSPLFAIVMRSSASPRQLECHGFVCQTPEDAIVIAATLYQSLMAHMGSGEVGNQRPRRPKNRNGVSCMSIASSAATTNIHIQPGSAKLSSRRSSASQRSLLPPPPRPPRKTKRTATSSLSGESDTMTGANEESSTEERKKRSPKGKRPPPLPANPPRAGEFFDFLMILDPSVISFSSSAVSNRPSLDAIYTDHSHSNDDNNSLSKGGEGNYPALSENSTGDILTRVAIPRSGSFLNTAGLTRYKSRATRRHTGKVGGGGGSPLGFSELFNEFRLQENLHSLDDILNAIINSDGMSFNDLKPIYKEFLLKLAVTLTKDELYQRSKSIMRRQKKKKLKRKNSNAQSQRRKLLIGVKGLKKVFRFGKFRNKKSLGRSGSFSKTGTNSSRSNQGSQGESNASFIDDGDSTACRRSDRSRIGTSGSEVSDARHEHTLTAHHNRNSSSGYVSCSECSYDSDACTCTSADRCYCSLGGDDINAKLNEASNRSSLPSCKSDEKCYCSMGETQGEEEGSTTWCDTDSCLSHEKCYC